jgi:hypothetical protein
MCGCGQTDLRPTVTQLRVAEMVRRIIQRAILTGHFDSEKIDLRDVGFDIEDVHMSKVCLTFNHLFVYHLSNLIFRFQDLGRATVFWNAIDLETKSELIQETIQRSVRILTFVAQCL